MILGDNTYDQHKWELEEQRIPSIMFGEGSQHYKLVAEHAREAPKKSPVKSLEVPEGYAIAHHEPRIVVIEKPQPPKPEVDSQYPAVFSIVHSNSLTLCTGFSVVKPQQHGHALPKSFAKNLAQTLLHPEKTIPPTPANSPAVALPNNPYSSIVVEENKVVEGPDSKPVTEAELKRERAREAAMERKEHDEKVKRHQAPEHKKPQEKKHKQTNQKHGKVKQQKVEKPVSEKVEQPAEKVEVEKVEKVEKIEKVEKVEKVEEKPIAKKEEKPVAKEDDGFKLAPASIINPEAQHKESHDNVEEEAARKEIEDEIQQQELARLAQEKKDADFNESITAVSVPEEYLTFFYFPYCWFFESI